MRKSYQHRDLSIDFGDKHLHTRFDTLCEILSNNMATTIPNACSTSKQIKGAYRFFSHANVTSDKMIKQFQATLDSYLNSSSTQRFLLLSDTVELDYNGKKGSVNLGPLNYLNQKGMHLHNSLLMSEIGLPISLFAQDYLLRSDNSLGKSQERKPLPIEEKESYRWIKHFEQGQTLCQDYPNIEVVYIADTESDMIELYQAKKHDNMYLVVRSKHDRLLADKKHLLYHYISTKEQIGQYEITVIDTKTEQERTATLEVRSCPLELTQHQRGKNKADRSIVPLYAIQIREINPPDYVNEPINWTLLTTLPIQNLEDALQIIAYYLLRWIIERFHYLLKSGGASVEKLQLNTKQRLQNAVTIYSIAAFKAMKIRYWAEKSPHSSIENAGITATECKVLFSYANKKISKKINYDVNTPPTIEQYCIVLGQIGGFTPSKSQKLPGFLIIARALEKLNNLIDAYLILCQ